MQTIHLDFETYSEADVRNTGEWAYSKHPSTEVLCMAYAMGDSEPILWLPSQEPPPFLKDLAHCYLHAWNSFFEWCIWHHVLKWPPVPVQQWEDTAALILWE